MVRSKRLAGIATLLIGLGLGLAACAGGDANLAYGSYPYDDAYYNDGFCDDDYNDGFLFSGGDFHDRREFRFHHHDRFDHDGFDHGLQAIHHTSLAGGFDRGGFGRVTGWSIGHGGGRHH
jgi:hypothetical protein